MTTVQTGDGWEMRFGRWEDSPPGVVDHVISDPPYSDHVHDKPMRHGGNSPGGYFETNLSFDAVKPSDVVPTLLGIARRWVICFCSMEHVGVYSEAAGESWVRGAVWIKPNGTPQFTGDRPAMWGESIAIMHRPGKKKWNAGGKRGEYRHNTCRSDRHHETAKPVDLMVELIEDFTDPGDLIWDPYAGSATTGVACLITGRRFIGHEMQERYFDIACDRLRATNRGTTLDAARAGQMTLIDAMGVEG